MHAVRSQVRWAAWASHSPGCSTSQSVIRPGTAGDNACIDSFNRKLRDECLDAQLFLDPAGVGAP